MIVDLAAFLSVSLLMIMTPGQDTALTIRNALLGGRVGGISTALGIATGQMVWTGATSAGLAALLIAVTPLFFALKLGGAIYLTYLGALALCEALRPDPVTSGEPVAGSGQELAPRIAFRQGLVSNIGNPKMAVFFTSLLPQFAPRSDDAFVYLLLLGLAFCTLTFVWLTGYAIVIARTGAFLRRSRVRRMLAGIMGTVFVVLGVRLATASR